MKTKILCVVCAVAVLLLSLGIFVGAAHINAEPRMRSDMREGMGTENGGILGDKFPNSGADAPHDGENEMLPDPNVPDENIGGAVEDSDRDGISDPKDSDDDGDNLPDKLDPDADGDKVEDEREMTGVVGIVIAVIIVVAVIAVVFALMPKKKK